VSLRETPLSVGVLDQQDVTAPLDAPNHDTASGMDRA
jgi:hypothetical protein